MKYVGLALWLRVDLGILLAAAATLTPSRSLFATQNPDSIVGDSAAIGIRLAKAIVDSAVWDTASSGPCQRDRDTVCLRRLREAFVPRIAEARAYLSAGFASHDSTVWLATASVALSGGAKLAKAGAYDQADVWLDQLLTELAHDTSGYMILQKHQIRAQASFWFGVTTALSLGPAYTQMVKDKSCVEEKAVKDRVARGLEALDVGQTVAPGVTGQIRNILLQYSSNIVKVMPAIQCRSF